MMKLEKQEEEGEIVVDVTERKTTVYTVAKPQWLGAVRKMETKETPQEAPLDMQESDQFVDYKDRKKVLENQDAVQVNVESGIEKAAPGLIIRKQKQVEKANVSETKASEQSTSSSAGAEIRVEDTVALLLKHKRGCYAADDETGLNIEDLPRGNQSGKDNKSPKECLVQRDLRFLAVKWILNPACLLYSFGFR